MHGWRGTPVSSSRQIGGEGFDEGNAGESQRSRQRAPYHHLPRPYADERGRATKRGGHLRLGRSSASPNIPEAERRPTELRRGGEPAGGVPACLAGASRGTAGAARSMLLSRMQRSGRPAGRKRSTGGSEASSVATIPAVCGGRNGGTVCHGEAASKEGDTGIPVCVKLALLAFAAGPAFVAASGERRYASCASQLKPSPFPAARLADS